MVAFAAAYRQGIILGAMWGGVTIVQGEVSAAVNLFTHVLVDEVVAFGRGELASAVYVFASLEV